MAANIYEELGAYAGMIVVPGVTVGQLAYANAQTMTSSGAFNVPTGGLVAANTAVPLFQAALGQIGQGWVTGSTLGQGNNKFQKGAAPKNQVFVAVECGFEIFLVSSTDPTGPITEVQLPASAVFALGDNFSWDLQIGGGNVRTIGTLLNYPAASGAWAARSAVTGSGNAPFNGANNGKPGCRMEKLKTPLVFPPQIEVFIQAKCGSGFTLVDQDDNTAPGATIGATIGGAGIYMCFRQHLRGYLMTMPV